MISTLSYDGVEEEVPLSTLEPHTLSSANVYFRCLRYQDDIRFIVRSSRFYAISRYDSISMLPTHKASTYLTLPPHSHGLPELAFLISTDEDFSIFRRFSELSARNLLTMQTELMHLDEELHILDRIRSHNITYQEHVVENAKRESLLSRLNTLMPQYHSALIVQKQVLQLSAPTPSMINNFDHWIQKALHGKPVGAVQISDTGLLPKPAETPDHYWRVQDYVLLKPANRNSILEQFTRNYLGWFFREHPPVPSSWSVYYFSRKKVERIKDYLAFPLGCIFLIAPALLFHYICDGEKRLAVLLSFIIGLSLVVQVFMGTTRQQTLGVALAYTGVMGLLLSSATQTRCH